MEANNNGKSEDASNSGGEVNNNGEEVSNNVDDSNNKDESFMLKWITTLLSSLNESGLGEDKIRKIVKDSCIVSIN